MENKWYIKYIDAIALWFLGKSNSLVLKLKNKYVVIMDENEYKEYKEFSENMYIVYENEEQLKLDFPDAKTKNTCSGQDCCGYNHICE